MKIIKPISLLLSIILAITPLAACTGGESNVTTAAESTAIPEETKTADPGEKLVSDGNPIYTIVRSAKSSNFEGGLAKKLATDIENATGVKFEYVIDFDGKVDNSGRAEILIGATNRPESIKAMEEIEQNGGYIVREEGNKIIIAGANDTELAYALSLFEIEYLGEENATVVGKYSPETAKPYGITTVSAETEEKLKVDPNFDYTEAYKINLSGIPGAVAPSGEIKTGLIVSEYDTLYDIVADFNVLSFGAKGDGKTDDTEAFRAALKAASAAGGGVVFVPKGYYCLTDSLTLESDVAIVGEIKPGTAEGTVLCIYGGKGTTDPAKSAFKLGPSASLQNLAIWYPEQTFVNGAPIPYPATVKQEWIDGLTVRNVTFVNSYIGFDYTGTGIYALQYTRDIYGTFLHIGYQNDRSLDIGKLENFHFSPKYWLESGLPGVPEEELLKTYMLRNSTGIILARIDWTYIADIYIEGYNIGIRAIRSTVDGYSGVTNGHIYNANITDTYTCLYIDDLSWLLMTKCNLSAFGNSGATAIRYWSTCGSGPSNQPGDICFVESTIESAGANAVVVNCSATVTYNNCKLGSVDGTEVANMVDSAQRFVNCSMEQNGAKYGALEDTAMPTLPDVDYTRDVVTKPKSKEFIDLSKAPYNAKNGEDITAVLQKALDDLKATGGTVYIPAGIYYISAGIDVHAGIELRGISIFASYTHETAGTKLYTAFGKNDPDGEALIDLYEGSGLRGLSVVYYEQQPSSLQKYSFTVRGKGSDVYIVDVGMTTSYNCVDFASYRCDNHYIEFIWGTGLKTGIKVGSGSENGIIRDCHFTTNCWFLRSDADYWNKVYRYMMDNASTFVIGESKNQVLYNNFTICVYKGIEVLDGAENVHFLGQGVDSSDIAIQISGNATVDLVNSQLVNLRDSGGSATYFDIVNTKEDFTGKVVFYNLASWGTTDDVFDISGSGEIAVVGGRTGRCDTWFANIKSGKLSFFGYNNASKKSFKIGDAVTEIHLTGNIMGSSVIKSLKNEKKVTGLDKE